MGLVGSRYIHRRFGEGAHADEQRRNVPVAPPLYSINLLVGNNKSECPVPHRVRKSGALALARTYVTRCSL